MLARDNFKKPVIEILKARVALRCSRPTCRVPTSAPSGSNAVNNMGIAAHICAASPKGPRYDKSMSSEERISIENAIWLCSNCSIEIDRDEKKFTIEILKKWKTEAEQNATNELGKKLPSNNDAIDTVATALTGLQNNYLSTAITNVHKASENSLESLDSRFRVKTSYSDQGALIKIAAREKVTLPFKIEPEIIDEFYKQHRQFIEHGESIEIKSKSIKINESKLFDEILNKNDEIDIVTFEPRKIKAVQKLWLVKKNGSIVDTFDDIHGLINSGTKSFSFSGNAFDLLFCFRYKKLLDKNDNNANFKMQINYDVWEGKKIAYIPFFDKIYGLYSKMAQGWMLFTALEVEGARILSSVGMQVNKWKYLIDTNNFLHYISCCRIISKEFDLKVVFTSNVSFSAEEHQKITNIANTIKGKNNLNINNCDGNASCLFVVEKNKENIKYLNKLEDSISMELIQEKGEKIMLFGNEFELPSKKITLDFVKPKVQGNIDKIKIGDLVKVEWIPQKQFKCTINYKS